MEIRPGLSDYTLIKYREEKAILASQPNPQVHYINVNLPDNLRLAKRYVEEVSFRIDVRIIRETVRSILGKLV